MAVPSISPVRIKRGRSTPGSPRGKSRRMRLHPDDFVAPSPLALEGAAPLRGGADELASMMGLSQLYAPPAPAVQRLDFGASALGGARSRPSCHPADVVKIDVGGTVFKTRRATATAVRGSLLEEIFSQPGSDSAFIDRDPRHFEVILGWLRDNSEPVALPVDDPAFVREVKFYRLAEEMLGEGQLLVVGGEDDDGPYDVCATLSPFTLTWAHVDSVPTSVDAHGCAAVDGVPYVCGGYDEQGRKLRDTYRWSAAGRRWERVADMNVGRARHQLVACGGLLYAVGGLLSKAGTDVHGEAPVVERFCPSTNRWTVVPTPLSQRYGFAACVVGAHVYVVGGLTLEGDRVAAVERYDTRSGEVAAMPDLPTPRAYLSAVAHEGRLFAIGGNDAGNAPTSTVEVLDLAGVDAAAAAFADDVDGDEEGDEDDKGLDDDGRKAGGSRVGWDEAPTAAPTATSLFAAARGATTGGKGWAAGPPLPTPRCDAGTAVLNGLVYVCGGEDDESFLRTVEILDPSTGQWAAGPPMPVAKSSLTACVLPF